MHVTNEQFSDKLHMAEKKSKWPIYAIFGILRQ